MQNKTFRIIDVNSRLSRNYHAGNCVKDIIDGSQPGLKNGWLDIHEWWLFHYLLCFYVLTIIYIVYLILTPVLRNHKFYHETAFDMHCIENPGYGIFGHENINILWVNKSQLAFSHSLVISNQMIQIHFMHNWPLNYTKKTKQIT